MESGWGKEVTPHLVQGVRLVRVLLPAALGSCAVLLFLLQPLMLLRALQGVRQKTQGSRQGLDPLSRPSVTPHSPQLNSPVGGGLLTLRGPLCLPGHPHTASPVGPTLSEHQPHPHALLMALNGGGQTEKPGTSSNPEKADFTPTLSLGAIWLWADHSLL